MDTKQEMMKVLCPLENEKTGKKYWMRLGSAYTNRDGSLNVYLDALPVTRQLQIRELNDRDRERMAQARANGGAGGDNLPF